jgi:gentisate 1,2-dioxygenase
VDRDERSHHAGTEKRLPSASVAVLSDPRLHALVTHEADEDAVLFSCSDQLVQEKLDLFREDRGNA